RTAPTVPVLTLDPANPTVDQATTLTAMTSDSLSGLVGGEWWIGADPGQGNATPLNISSASLSALIPAIVSPGHYTVSARAIDAAGNWSNTGTTTLTVTSSTNSRPVAVAQVVVTPEDSAVSIVLGGSDADALDVLSFSVTSIPAHGTLTGTAPDLVYTPETNFHGDDAFTFTVGDGIDTSDPATVSITVVAVNDVPTITTPVALATAEGTTLPIVATVGDVDGDIVTVTWNVAPGPGVDAGAVCVIADLAITDITCTDDGTFTLTATADDANRGTASAQIELTVANADPQVVITGEPAGPVPQGTPVDITATITDPGTNDTHACSIDWGDSAVTPGIVDAGTCTATHTYTTPAVNTVTVTVTDDDNATDTTTTTITITQPNRPPVANPAMLSAVSGVATPLTLSGSDPDGDTLAFVILTSPAHGTLTAAGPLVTYTSVAGYVGGDSFSFAVSDGEYRSPTVTVPITVTQPLPAGLKLSVASDPKRSNDVRPLDGAVLTGGSAAYIFLGPEPPANVRRVTFLLDGVSFSVDSSAPYDFAGTSRRCRRCGSEANPFESNLLSLGQHRVTAIVQFRDKSLATLETSFTVADTTPHRLMVSSSPRRDAPMLLDGAIVSGRRYVFLGEADDTIAGLRTVVFLVDGKIVGDDSSAPYDARGTRRDGTANALDTRKMRNGMHHVTAIAILDGGARIIYQADVRVAN
ncbi:MAG: Ig-like domain-containing protein, partial [Ilumatobacteraceae bacterium]